MRPALFFQLRLRLRPQNKAELLHPDSLTQLGTNFGEQKFRLVYLPVPHHHGDDRYEKFLALSVTECGLFGESGQMSQTPINPRLFHIANGIPPHSEVKSYIINGPNGR